ncbi:SUF system Fe-S cluster assembly protein [Sphingorhabdus lutea]|uniref:SUF system Fe-S cluster assembly protein n=1 Tax=Sphingorhabdus lutea TaxID=1913578 RepID=A0A1L3J9M1_9SPHN|nr:SUF system Fe-S cluster assembly protein [Sphingorhabdus lutea]APG61818.1 SUF system Fe-S cluster assembly protein [Sphingorhabdus lutea]
MSNEEIKIETVDSVEKPPKARVDLDAMNLENNDTISVETARETMERKRDYLAGFLAEKPKDIAPTQVGGDVYEAIIDTLKSIYDPEIPVNIYDLGLIYNVEVTEDGHAVVSMTLTTPHCPVAESMPGEVELQVGSVPGVGHAEVNLVWDPPWDPAKMSDEARLELGML